MSGCLTISGGVTVQLWAQYIGHPVDLPVGWPFLDKYGEALGDVAWERLSRSYWWNACWASTSSSLRPAARWEPSWRVFRLLSFVRRFYTAGRTRVPFFAFAWMLWSSRALCALIVALKLSSIPLSSWRRQRPSGPWSPGGERRFHRRWCSRAPTCLARFSACVFRSSELTLPVSVMTPLSRSCETLTLPRLLLLRELVTAAFSSA